MQPEKILEFFAKYIETELGIVYADHNYFQLQNRLEDIAKLLNMPSLEELHKLAQAGIWGQFKQLLLDTATNNETSFFRDPKVFSAIETYLVNQVKEGKRGANPFRIWSAASSTGQEALSVAMTILECAAKTNLPIPFSILGTDISERVLNRAKAATYSQLEVQRGLPAPLMVKYFKKTEQSEWTASANLTKFTEFQTLNLKSAFPFKNSFDLVLCRNVLIYQAPASKKEILARITATLTEGGYLILGSGESLIGLSNDYETESVNGAVVYRKKGADSKAA
jgi:chemotaxis protein methyltransferase CheR